MTPLALTPLGFALGFAAGLVHFATLRRVTALYLGGSGAGRALALQIVRLAGLAAVLVLLAWLGAGPLLGGALGVLVARGVILHRAGKEG